MSETKPKRKRAATRAPAPQLPTCHARGCEDRQFIVKKTGMASWFCLAHYRKLTPTQKRAWDEGLRDEVLEWLYAKDLMIQQAYRYELDPTPQQRRWMAMHCRQHRVAYNFAFDVLDRNWNDNREREPKDRVSAPNDLYTQFTREMMTRAEMQWAHACVANSRNYAFSDCQKAFGNFFSRLAKRAAGTTVDKLGYPRPKKRVDSNRFTIQPPTGLAGQRWASTHTGAFVDDKGRFGKRGRAYPEIRVSKMPSWREDEADSKSQGWIRTKERIRIKGRILRVAFETRAGRWWVSLMVEREAKVQWPKELPDAVVGIDFGINAVITMSRPYLGPAPEFLGEDRQTIVSPRPLQVALAHRRVLARRMSRRASTYYRKKMLELRDLALASPSTDGHYGSAVGGRVPLKAWKSRSHEGPFHAVRRTALRLRHIVQDGDDVVLTAFGVEQLRSCQPFDVTLASGEIKQIVPASKGWEAAKRAVGTLDLRIQNIRRDHANKVSSWLVRTYGTIVCEGYNVRELVSEEVGYRQRRREFADVGIGDLRLRIGYKAGWYGGRFVQLPADEPTDRTCSACGQINENLAPLATLFRCETCGFAERRQRNTALYCESFGRGYPPEGAGGGQPAHGPGDDGSAASKRRRKAKGTGNEATPPVRATSLLHSSFDPGGPPGASAPGDPPFYPAG